VIREEVNETDEFHQETVFMENPIVMLGMSAAAAKELVDSIIETEIDHWAEVKNTNAFRAGQATWTRHSSTQSEQKNVLRREILIYYNSLKTNSKGICLSEIEISGFFSKILTKILEVPIRLDYFDVSALGQAIVGFILSVAFFNSNTASQLITDQFEQYKENNVDADNLARSIRHHFEESIPHLNRNQTNMIKAANILTSTNRAFFRIFHIQLDLTITDQHVSDSDSVIRQLADRLDRL